MLRKQSILSDSFWVISFQTVAAAGQLIGIRLLTSTLSPTTFGEVSLLVGLVTLVSGALINPTMQTLLRYYPEYLRENQLGQLNDAINHQLQRFLIWVVPLIIAIILLFLLMGWSRWVDLILLGSLIGIEFARMRSVAVLSALRHHRTYGLWAVVESWGKPVFATLLVRLMQNDTSSIVLFAHMCMSLVALLVFRRFIPSFTQSGSLHTASTDLEKQIWKYTIPLLPLGFLGWISGTFDRYIIGSLLSPAEVGLYVAMYGVASRPMIMFATMVENTIRPVYQQAMIEADAPKVYVHLRNWILIVLIGSSLALGFTYYSHDLIASLLLGEEFYSTSFLMVWIVGGYMLLGLSSIPTRICYARDRTDYVLLTVVAGSLSSVILGYICTYYWGLRGAAIATPIYFGVQLLVATLLSTRMPRMHKPEGLL